MSESFDLQEVHNTAHHPCISDLTKVLNIRTGNSDEQFFRMEIAYFLCKLATCMQCHVVIPNKLDIPVNAYVLALSTSGSGKGTSISVIEDEIIDGFKNRYLQETFPYLAEKNIAQLVQAKAIRYNLDPNDCLAGLTKKFEELGAYNFTFDSATTPAIKQFRELLNLAGTGAINISIDEIGSNLLSVEDVMRTFMELYDKGKTKAKLVKNSKDNQRGEDFNLPTPANLLMFGTPAKLLNGSIEEDTLYSWLREGYGRRLLFAYGNPSNNQYSIDDAEKLFDKETDPQIAQIIKKWRAKFINLADAMNNQFKVDVPRDVGILHSAYRIICMNRASQIPDHQDIQQAEMMHRHFKALKIAGALAFIDNSPIMTKTELYQAIKLVEEDSGDAFTKLMNRDPSYVKLAKYICTCGKEVTHADLTEELPFYKTSSTTRKEQMALARAYGATHNLLIKVETKDNIEFFSGETLEENDLKNLIISSSFDFAEDYTNSYEKWDDLCNTLPRAGAKNGMPLSFINHHLLNGDPDASGKGHGHRQNNNCLKEFNLAVLDIDGTSNMNLAADMLDDYTWLMYSTKSADPKTLDRFRLILPLSHTLKLDEKDYKEFMNNIINWLPFDSDTGANQPARKWNCNPKAKVMANDGKLLNILPFIPHTSGNDSYKESSKAISDLGALEKWFYREISEEGSGRNNSLYKYAMVLKDNGHSFEDIKERISIFNQKLPIPLSERELIDTIFKTLAKNFI